MPDVTTSRSRTVTISGSGSFGVDSAAVFLPTWDNGDGGGVRHSRKAWVATSQVKYWGKSVQVLLECHDGWIASSASTPSVKLTIVYGGFSKVVTVPGTPYTGGPYIQPAQSALQYFTASSGSFTFSEVVICSQHVNPNPYEVRTGFSFTCSASISVHFVDTLGSGTQTISASVTMTDGDIAGFTTLAYSNYDYSFAFGGIAVHFDTAANIAFDQPGLISTYSGVNTTFGKPTLSGNGGAITFHWAGGEADINPNWGTHAPSAEIQFFPSWAMTLSSQVYHYKDGTEVGATLDHYYGTHLVASFTSGTLYRYPSSGLIHWVGLTSFDSGAVSGGTGFQPGVPGDYTLTGSNYGPIGLLLQVPGDPVGAATKFTFNPTWANGYGTYTGSIHPPAVPAITAKILQPYQLGSVQFSDQFTFAMFEANTAAAGTARWIADSSGPTFPGMAAWDGAPVVSLVSGAGIDGNALSVKSVGAASVGTSLRYLLLHQGFRYARLRLQGAVPSTTTTSAPLAGATDLSVASSAGFYAGDHVTIGPEAGVVASVSAGHILLTTGLSTAHPSGTSVARSTAGRVLFSLRGSSTGTLAWLVTPALDGSMNDVEIDLTAPQYELNTVSNTWETTARVVAPSEFARDPQLTGDWFGAQIAVLPVDAGTYLFDHLQGYTKSDGDRTALLYFTYVDGHGDKYVLTEYERADLIAPGASDPMIVDSWFVNGMRGAEVAFNPLVHTSATDYWNHLKGLYDSATLRTMADGHTEPNSTGITVVVGSAGTPNALMVFGGIGVGRFAFSSPADQPAYGYWVLPLDDLILQGQLRAGIAAYYGAGDLTAASGGYSEVVAFTGDWLFDGETILNAGVAGAKITLNDNDTGTEIANATTNLDGLARLPSKYGVFYPADNTDGSAQWFTVTAPSTTTTDFIFAGDNTVKVASGAGFAALDYILVDGAETVQITAISGLTFTVTPVFATFHNNGVPVLKQLLPTDSVTWTALGKTLNSYWLDGDVTPKDRGYWGIGHPTGRADIVILDRYQTFLIVSGFVKRGIWNMHDRTGAYHRASVEAGKIRYRRSDRPAPYGLTWDSEVDATAGPNDSEPRMSASSIDRIHLLFTRGAGDVMLTTSDDDGETWSDPPVALFTTAKHPANVATDVGTVIHAAYVSGNIQAKEEFAPGQFSSAWTFQDASGVNITLDDDTFAFSLAKEGAARYLLVVSQAGAVKEYASADDCRTFEIVT